MKEVIKKGVINTLAASGGNLKTDTVTGSSWIVADNSADPLVPIIPLEIKGKSVKDVVYITGAEEVRRFWEIGLAAEETIVASTKYSIEIDYAQYKNESTRRGSAWKYGYTSAAALTGTASTDRYNVFTALNDKINNHTGNYVTSYLVHKVAFTGGTSVGDVTETLVLGETATQATSGATGKVAKIQITSGTMAGDNAAGFLWLYDMTGTWSASSLATTFSVSTSVTVTTAALMTEGQGLAIEDDANYWISTPGRGGASSVSLNASFTTASASITRDVTYAQGQGDHMLAQAPVYNYKKDDIISGDIEHTYNETPVSTKSYTMAIIKIEDRAEYVAGSNEHPTQYKEVHLYMDESNSTNLTNLKSALTALVGL
jgi:hypothetical protein